MFHAIKVNANVFEYIYAAQFRVTVPCRKYLPITERVEITQLDVVRSKFKDEFPKLSKFFLAAAIERIRGSQLSTTRQVCFVPNLSIMINT